MTKDAILYDLREISRENSISSYKRMVCTLAADLIENQAREIEALMKANAAKRDELEKYRWIPVEEALPQDGEWVLCSNTDGRMRVLSRDYLMEDWDFTVIDGHGYAYPHEIVTHWMPLPEFKEE